MSALSLSPGRLAERQPGSLAVAPTALAWLGLRLAACGRRWLNLRGRRHVEAETEDDSSRAEPS